MTRYKRNPRRDRQIARILEAVAAKPMTTNDLAKLLHLHQSQVCRYLDDLRNGAPRRVYVSGFQPVAPNLKPPRLFSAGDKKDAVFPRKSKKKPDRVEARKRQILGLLALPQTAEQLAARLGITSNRTRVYLAMLRSRKTAKCTSRHGTHPSSVAHRLPSMRWGTCQTRRWCADPASPNPGSPRCVRVPGRQPLVFKESPCTKSLPCCRTCAKLNYSSSAARTVPPARLPILLGWLCRPSL